MKKTLSFLLATILSLGVVGCGTNKSVVSNNEGTEKPTTEVSEDVASETESASQTQVVELDPNTTGSLKVWIDKENWANAVIKEFNKKYPNITVTNEPVAQVDTRLRISLDGPAGTGADIFLSGHNDMNQLKDDGLILDLPENLQSKYQDKIIDSALGTVMYDGVMYGMPVSIENIALFYNKDLWGPEPPKTFEEIMTFAETYNDDAKGKYAMRFPIDNAYINIIFMTAFGYELFGPDHSDYKLINFDTEPVTKGLEFFSNFRKVYNVNAVDSTFANTMARFQAGEVPLTISGPWDIQGARDNNINFGVAKIPTIDGKQPIAFSGNIIANVSSFTENEDLAFAFLDFLGSEEGARILYEEQVRMPALKDISNIPGLKDDEYLKGIQQQSEFTVPMPQIPENNFFWVPMQQMLTSVWDKLQTIEEAQASAMDAYETLLQTGGKTMK